MNDTHANAAVQFKKMMMSKSDEERLLMGCAMYDAAKKIVQSAVLAQRPAITREEMKKEIFLRFYGRDFSQADKEKLFSRFVS
ncbi:MAG: hypothetical protein ACYTAO_16845 [Planctomycetota bacterium]|jgi:hypothetical protein